MFIDEKKAIRARGLIREARSLGLKVDGMSVEQIEQLLEQQKAAGSWEEKMAASRLRRLKIAAAYIAGASLSQLAREFGISVPALRNLTRDVPPAIADRIALERVRYPKSRLIFTQSQVRAMLDHFDENKRDYAVLSPLVIAPSMIQAATALDEGLEPREAGEASSSFALTPEQAAEQRRKDEAGK